MTLLSARCLRSSRALLTLFGGTGSKKTGLDLILRGRGAGEIGAREIGPTSSGVRGTEGPSELALVFSSTVVTLSAFGFGSSGSSGTGEAEGKTSSTLRPPPTRSRSNECKKKPSAAAISVSDPTASRLERSPLPSRSSIRVRLSTKRLRKTLYCSSSRSPSSKAVRTSFKALIAALAMVPRPRARSRPPSLRCDVSSACRLQHCTSGSSGGKKGLLVENLVLHCYTALQFREELQSYVWGV